MTQPLMCQTCTFWKRLRPSANWGECSKLHERLDEGQQAYVSTRGLIPVTDLVEGEVIFNTRDVFFCAHHEQTAQHKQTLVEAVQHASREFNERSKQ